MAYLDQVEIGGVTYDLTDTKGRAMIAPKEASSTASVAHATGAYFTYNDLLYQATADIAVGGTITPNTNCKAVTLGSDVSDLKSAVDELNDVVFTSQTATLSNSDFEWTNGYYDTHGDIADHQYYKHTNKIKTKAGDTISYTNLRAPNNYNAQIACFKDGVYSNSDSQIGQAYVDYNSGTFVVPAEVTEVSFITYVNFSTYPVSITMPVYSDIGAEIENIENEISDLPDIRGDISDIHDMIAPTEATSTASAAHIPGTDSEYFIYGGTLYQATGNIAQGGAIVTSGSGKNCKIVPEGLSGEVSGVKTGLNRTNAFINVSKKTGHLVRASDGAYVSSASYNAYEYSVYGLSEIKITPGFTNDTYGYAFYGANKTFLPDSGGVYTTAGEITVSVPSGAYYMRATENTGASGYHVDADWGLLIETKAGTANIKTISTELYSSVYDTTNYNPSDRLAVQGKYYDANGVLQTASNMDTTGIIPVPFGIVDIYYKAYRNTTIPTILFFDDSMDIVGTVIATTAPVYGDVYYEGYATIPATASKMEFSMVNTVDGQNISVRYAITKNNAKRIEILETDPLYGKKITCTGDSITAATHSYPGHGYVEQIAQAHGMTVDNQAIWGAVFPTNKTSGGNPRGSVYSTIANMDANADIVIISGGINDAEYYASDTYWGSVTGDFDDTLDPDTFCGALEGICKAALQKWSGKPIIFVFEHRMTLDNTAYGAHFNDVEYPLMVEILQKWGIPFVDLYHEMPSLSYNDGYKEAYTTGDGVHPNIAGYAKFYVPRVYSKIKEVMGL